MLNGGISLLRSHTPFQPADLTGFSLNVLDYYETYCEASTLQAERYKVEERDELRAEPESDLSLITM